MKQSDFPARFSIPFANAAASGYIRDIPTASQIATTPGAASLTDGFPPVTFDPVSAGGTPPSGQDMNGLLNWVTSVLRAFQSGYFGPWDATFAGNIGGYPMNAIVSGATAGTYYVSTADDNVTTPGAAGASWQSLFTGLQSALGFTPVQQGGGLDQASDKVLLGRDSTFAGLRYSYGGAGGNVSCGYLISSYGPETGGPGASFAQIGDISLGTDTRLSYRGVASNAAYYTGALLYDVQVVQTNLTSEQTTRANADAALQASKQDNLGFTPVQQGGGPDQATGRVNIGSSAANPSVLRASVNGNDTGPLVSGQFGAVLTSGDSPVWGIHWTAAGRPMAGWGSAGVTWSQIGTYADVQGVQANVTAEATARANADAALQAAKQDALGFTPVQQGGGLDQASDRILLGRDSTFAGLRYSYGGAAGNVSCGYLISSYGPETGGPGASFAQIGDISLGTDTRLSYRGVASNAAYYTGALLYDVQVVQTNLTSEQTTRANADAALQANFANYLPLSANGKNVTYGNGGGYRVALQTDGNFVIYDAATPIFGVGGPTGTVSLGLPVAGSVRSGTVSGGVYTVINDVMELTFSVSDVADQSTIEFPMAFSQTPNVFFQPSLEANGDNLSCSLISATATGCTVQIHNNANGSSTSAPTLVVRASGTI